VTDRRLVVVRHGITDWNREGRFQGHLDPPLADDGRREADLVAARIAREPDLRPARIVASSLARAHETAQAIGAAVGIPVDADQRLMEIGQGEWEGRTHDEVSVTDAARYEVWRTSDGLPPGGESIDGTLRRVAAAMDALGRGAWPVVLVSHGGTIRVLARFLFGLTPQRSWALDVDNASISVATAVDEGWRLDRWNDTLHLLGEEPTHTDEIEGRPLAL
jgi:broad specificity phosphatase PhoE